MARIIPASKRGAVASEYVFIDEWDVDAPREAVFTALADASTYPEWWKPVYISTEAAGSDNSALWSGGLIGLLAAAFGAGGVRAGLRRVRRDPGLFSQPLFP